MLCKSYFTCHELWISCGLRNILAQTTRIIIPVRDKIAANNMPAASSQGPRQQNPRHNVFKLWAFQNMEIMSLELQTTFNDTWQTYCKVERNLWTPPDDFQCILPQPSRIILTQTPCLKVGPCHAGSRRKAASRPANLIKIHKNILCTLACANKIGCFRLDIWPCCKCLKAMLQMFEWMQQPLSWSSKWLMFLDCVHL